MLISFRRTLVGYAARALRGAVTLLFMAACHYAQPGISLSSPVPQGSEAGASRSFAGADLVPTGHGGFYVLLHSGMVGSGDPLYVIDGTPMMISRERGIDWFKPEDIKEIRVLKGPDERAVY